MGRSGGLISIWKIGLFSVNFHFSGEGFIGVCGVMEISRTVVYLVNVYSPCFLEGKRKVWEDLCMSKRGFPAGEWCIAGDFNAVLSARERRGISSHINQRELDEFSSFIQSMGVIDVPLLGKKFSWFNLDGSAMSRIDRFLLTEKLIDEWKVAAQWIGDRDISDHCPMWLKTSDENWGPKPFRFNNCWLDHKEFLSYVTTCWGSFHVEGWKGYMLKEKKKLLKEKLKWWNKEVFGIIDLKIDKIVEDINALDNIVAEGGQIDVEGRKLLSVQFWNHLHARESLLLQKSRAR